MGSILAKVAVVIVVVIIVLIFVLPIGIFVGSRYVSTDPTPPEYMTDFGNDAYRTEIICKYFVRSKIEDMTMWRYSDTPNPEEPTCDYLTLYWHNDWLLDHGTSLF